MAERIDFTSDDWPYHSMISADHLARYHLVRRNCAGRRVLDIACGEGYGARLLEAWGATEVVGVDISKTAIGKANDLFGSPKASFVCEDACDSATLLAKLGKFDLIVSFETVEHVAKPEQMLQGFKDMLNAGGAIVVSCPNDTAMIPDRPNEFHRHIYSMEEFRNMAASVLGEPTGCFLGTPVIGYGLLSLNSTLIAEVPKNMMGLLQCEDMGSGALLPHQAGHEVRPHNAAFFVLSWGVDLSSTVVAAPISNDAYEGPWNNWVAQKKEADILKAELGMLRAECDAKEHETGALKAELGMLRAECEAKGHEVGVLKALAVTMRAQLRRQLEAPVGKKTLKSRLLKMLGKIRA